MLNAIELKNFKCFKAQTRIPVGTINLLTGINGRGKSTLLQSLLLMHQTLEHSRTTDKLVFNGNCIELGKFNDARNAEISRNEDINLTFGFQRGDDTINIYYQFGEDESDETSAQIHKLRINGRVNAQEASLETSYVDNTHNVHIDGQSPCVHWRNLLIDPVDFQHDLLDFARDIALYSNIHYISADRIGPQDYYPIQSFAEFPNVGRRGEFTPNVLYRKKDEVVAEAICLLSGDTHTLLDQAQAWLSTVFDGARVELTPTDANIVLMSLNSEETPLGFKPVNVGFGYSYALPIIVAGLIAQPGEILIVENPEAHLHPYAQSQITKFLARVSANGVQVFIESHSDHVLNALRICVLDDLVANDELHILYFGKGQPPEVIRIPVQDDGAIELWPEGFFDQLDKDFSRLFGV